MSLGDLREIASRALKARIGDVHVIEVTAFVSGIVTSMGLLINSLFEERGGFPSEISVKESVIPSQVFNFENLDRNDLIKHLRDCCGLDIVACSAALDSLEAVISRRLDEGDKVELEHIGTFRRIEGVTEFIVPRVLSL